MSSLTCQELVEQVTDFVDEALEPNAEAAFADHLADCPGCRRYVEQLAQVMRMLRGAGAAG
jgi:anti-sigma factor RsiW